MSTSNDDEDRYKAIIDIVNPSGPETAQNILAKLGLDGIPSKEQIYKDIEERLLLPKSRLPDHWLPTYQV